MNQKDQRQAGDSTEIEITPEMVRAGAGAVCDVIGEEPLLRGEPEKIAKGVYLAMRKIRKEY